MPLLAIDPNTEIEPDWAAPEHAVRVQAMVNADRDEVAVREILSLNWNFDLEQRKQQWAQEAPLRAAAGGPPPGVVLLVRRGGPPLLVRPLAGGDGWHPWSQLWDVPA